MFPPRKHSSSTNCKTVIFKDGAQILQFFNSHSSFSPFSFELFSLGQLVGCWQIIWKAPLFNQAPTQPMKKFWLVLGLIGYLEKENCTIWLDPIFLQNWPNLIINILHIMAKVFFTYWCWFPLPFYIDPIFGNPSNIKVEGQRWWCENLGYIWST